MAGKFGSPREWSFGALVAASLFGAIAAFCLIMTVLGFTSVDLGLLPSRFWTNPATITIFVVLGSFLLTFVVVLIMRSLVLTPVQRMVDAVTRLGDGDFTVRVEVGEGLHPRELEQFSEGFNAAARQLGSVETLRRDFIHDFSHEFKTPISSINGFADLLRADDVSDAERREWAGIIYRESQRLASLSSDILLLRQAESLDAFTDATQVDVAEQVRQALIVMQGKWASKQLIFDIGVDDEAFARGNAAFLERVWVNLLDNACKFSPAGGGVRVALSVDGECAAFRVENDGPSMEPEALERIFDRFYQADESHATQGCGLGLSLVKRVVELQGGTVAAASTPEGHTTFTVSLPLDMGSGDAR